MENEKAMAIGSLPQEISLLKSENHALREKLESQANAKLESSNNVNQLMELLEKGKQ